MSKPFSLYCIESGFASPNPERDAFFQHHPVFTVVFDDNHAYFVGADGGAWRTSTIQDVYDPDGSGYYLRITTRNTVYHVTFAPECMVNKAWIQ